MNTIYYINGQEFYKEDNTLDYFINTYNKKIVINKQHFIIKHVNYDVFANTISVVIIPEIKFSYDIYVKNVSSSLIEQLEYIGYIKSDVCGSGKHLITNASQGKYYFTDCDYSNGCMGYVCENNKISLGIAGIRNDSDIYQWFIFPDGECEFCECDSRIDEWGDFEGTDFPRKLTPEEIINLFNSNK